MFCSKKLIDHGILEEKIKDLETKNSKLNEKIIVLEETNSKLVERINLLEKMLTETNVSITELTELVKKKMPSQLVSTVASAATAVGMTLLSQNGITLPMSILQKFTS